MTKTTEFLVIGGGSTGTSILYHLAKLGHKECLLVERGPQVAAGQTSKSTALLRTHYSHPTVALMALLSFRFFRRFEKEVSGAGCGFRETGLLVCADEKFEKGLAANVAMFREVGIVSKLIEKDEARRMEPLLNTDSFSAVAYEPESGYADPSLTASAFASAAVSMGASVRLNTEVTNVKAVPGRGMIVETTSGDIQAKRVVIATGVWSGKLFKTLGIDVPVWTVRHPVAVFRRPEEYTGTRPLIFDFPREFYYKPEGQSLFFAGSLEAELDRTPVDPDNYRVDVSFEEVMKYSEGLAQVLPRMAEKGTFQRSYTGLYDMTPDQHPIIDEFSADGYEGLYCLVGLSGHGFKLAPEFGRAMATLLTGRRPSEYDVSIFRRTRFKEGKLFTSKYPLSTVA